MSVSVKSIKYNLIGIYSIEPTTGTFYKFKKGEQEVFVPEEEIGQVDIYRNSVPMRSKLDMLRGGDVVHASSLKYNINGDYTIEKQSGKFYHFQKPVPDTYVPASEMYHVDGNARFMKYYRRNNTRRNNTRRNNTRRNNRNNHS